MPLGLLIALSLAAFASAATLRIADPLLPEIAHEFGMTPGAAAAIAVTTFTFAYGGIQIFFGPIGDRFGKVRTIAGAALASVVTSLACALSDTADELLVARILAGATAGGIIPLCLAWIGDVVAFADRQRVLGRFLIGQTLGFVSGQAVGGLLGDLFGWRAAFVMLAALFFIGGVALLLVLRINGAAASDPPAASVRNLSFRDLLKRPRVRLVLSTVFLEGGLMYAAFAYIGTDLQHRGGASVALAGAMLTAFAAGALAYSFAVGRMLTRMTRSRIAISGALILAAGYLILAADAERLVAIPALAVIGLGFTMLHNCLQVEATQMIPEARGTALAMFASMLFAGQALGVAIAGPVFDWVGAPALYLAVAFILPLIAWRFARGISVA
jgi:predicted MFS family arabinose efflux permease